MKPKPRITRNRDRQLQRRARRIVGRLCTYGWLTISASASDKPRTMILDELRRAEAGRK